MKLPLGFRASGVHAGIKPSGKPDLALLVGDGPLAWALASTENLVKAPCVVRNRARAASEQPVRALLVNAGNANCATGEAGIWDNEDMAAAAAAGLELEKVQEVLTASTGVIGQRLPIEAVRRGVPAAVAALGDEVAPFAEAILTTDLVPKTVEVRLAGGARVVGVAKGSGMIHPNLATMFAFVLTDAIVDQRWWRRAWARTVRRTFNQLTVDGDTSTNDMAIALASQRLPADPDELAAALEAVAADLARAIARDGEGATTLLTVRVRGGRSVDDAMAAARGVAASSLVKAAVHGRDPNWGRILSAVGQSGAVADLGAVTVSVQGTPVYRGQPLAFDAAALSQAMRSTDVLVEVDLAAGEGQGEAWGCDLSADYVTINALYTT
ncbi:MAG: bifunctional glutamate N-acetyltransferase/amino-acid acetyltransferase ArgJ [Trueperaceae bacterium]|nr:bifunctional glutamate N-acetyltransferase/amino-acid acetyltransferase ArgJ [Trueperaceae bacterium]